MLRSFLAPNSMPRISLVNTARNHISQSRRAAVGFTFDYFPLLFRAFTTRPETLTDQETHFGFQTVPESEKERLVSNVFSSVASSYDIMNDVMSLGVHRLWKNEFVRQMAPRPDLKLLDVAGGTGDIAYRFLDSIRNNYGNLGSTHVTIADINPEMLKVGQQRLAQFYPMYANHVTFEEGNAENLSNIPNESFDIYSIAFGIRNCTHMDRVLRDAYRTLKKGGRLMILEFGKVDQPILAQLYETYSFRVIPHLGHIIAGDRDAYQYLVESIERFPSPDTVSQMIQDAGFQTLGKGYEPITFGVACIWNGWKI